jgi:putative intracellular protease/amidase
LWPSKRQRTPGRYAIVTVGASAAPITTMGGVRIVPDATLGDIEPGDAAMLILPGAETWQDAERHAELIGHARARMRCERPVAAICGATYGLAAAGLLDDRAHTSNAAIYLAASGYAGGHLYREEPAVTDRGLVTAGGCFPVQFAAHIFAALGPL